MSLADAHAADILLTNVRPSPLTKKERAQRDRDREARTFTRLVGTIEKCLTRSGCVTKFDLQDFEQDELDRHFTKARLAAGVEVEA